MLVGIDTRNGERAFEIFKRPRAARPYTLCRVRGGGGLEGFCRQLDAKRTAERLLPSVKWYHAADSAQDVSAFPEVSR